jgi:hypothetical protein
LQEFRGNLRIKDKFQKEEKAFSGLGDTNEILQFMDIMSLLNLLD